MSDFSPNGFSSTPVKKSSNREGDFHKPAPSLDVGVLSDDEDTFSLLSPIYHDSYDSGDDVAQSSGKSSPNNMNMSDLSERCELPKASLDPDQMQTSAVIDKTPASLTAWELWLLNKTKEDRIKLEKKAEEERLLEEKKRQEEKDNEQKVALINQRIQDWLKMKREQEKQEQDLKHSKEQEALTMKMEKQRETECKSQEKYKEWLQKKNQEKAEKEKKLKEEASLKEKQEKERRRRAEEKFKEWLNQNTKNIVSPKPTCQGHFGKAYPSPSFYNPIPWKPVHIPPETVNNSTDRKAQRQPKGQRGLSCSSRRRDSVGAVLSQQRR